MPGQPGNGASDTRKQSRCAPWVRMQVVCSGVPVRIRGVTRGGVRPLPLDAGYSRVGRSLAGSVKMSGYERSRELLARARKSLAGGVSSDVRVSMKPFPLYFERGEGALLYDADGNAYIDYALGQGPLILGHSPPAVLEAVDEAMRRGQIFAGQHELEIEAAEAVVELVPCAGLVRFSLSGSEAVHAAVRLARAGTGRTKLLRFEGHYHGWFDGV